MKMQDITCVILSGGKSSRMGKDKALLTFHGKRFVDMIAEQFASAGEILFSVRENADFPEISLPHIVDEYPGCGPLAGIHSALKHAKYAWVFIIACDTPFITRSAVEEMLHSVTEETSAVIPIEQDGRLHVLCALYHKNNLPRIEQYLREGNYRVRKVMDHGFTKYLSVTDFHDFDKVFRNINTMDEYKEVLDL